ncbi:acetyl-CoA carboxylase biotin carboxyl carrier protein [Yoonia sp. TsM2_T14_4]|jgi:acetyl-CoA carboxylase biotin carboxyl carrier protein|uniref:acetyl-CoA carboxylase biotin carboxyl carrier protein n=1 Tax=Yoonia sp. TsM2_T14_4 TaxID=3415141 RepID=UPI003C70C69C
MSNKTSHDSDVSFIQALAELLRQNDLTELQVKRDYGENDSLNVRVSRHTQTMVQASAPAATAMPAAPAAAAAPAASTNVDPANHPGAVTSPMVGTVYMAPEPTAAPFVAIGQTVREGDTILIIEAMKTMNHIPAPRAGTVRRILVEDGGAVEYGAPLVIIE